MRNIVLIGFMGTGKSTVGRRLAQSLAWNFADTDYEIGEVTKLSVSEIFRRHGETRFRSEERIVVERLSQEEKLVIATGGGTVLNPSNWRALAENGIIISLYATLEVILNRIGHRNDRPLLRNTREEIESLWSERQPYYEKADFTIDTTFKTIDEVVSEILALLGGMAIHEFTRMAKD
ncbi:shikimate kinase [Desulfosporosinus sp. PR]|uniref:shikimate kinase n=1 Tax=Candidatus Desulfosporosinus nitrosoreducens TaxID=3401928 RepID=UPI0027F0785D|nr:shikimate kinase [Desulfosporosinus sp. PR]MDQ7095760.1 shikimate kinase [Desulfosporosinus sp. PR]